MIADDLKLFCLVYNKVVADLLQTDLNNLYEWCVYYNFTLNINSW